MVIKSTLKWKENQKLSFVANWSVDSLFLIVDFLNGLDKGAGPTAAGTYNVIHLVALNIVINRYTSSQGYGHIYLNIILLPGLGPQQPYGNVGKLTQAVREEFRYIQIIKLTSAEGGEDRSDPGPQPCCRSGRGNTKWKSSLFRCQAKVILKLRKEVLHVSILSKQSKVPCFQLLAILTDFFCICWEPRR